ncbi:MAG: hypothetical protein GPJ51_13270 [Candidatus Heimdallarchaeota archaeon]|nr:hypothetical protein [Candidatus Heimdallarchaeota archaeon]
MTFFKEIHRKIIFTLTAVALFVFVIFQIVMFGRFFGQVKLTYLVGFQLQLFLPYVGGLFLLLLSLVIVEDFRNHLQLERILAQIFWIVYFVFAILNRESLFRFYVRDNGDTSNLLANLIIIEIFFLLAIVFTGITYRTEVKGYLQYAFYAVGGVSFIFFLIRISVEWVTIIRDYILLTEFWLEIVLMVILSITLAFRWIKPKHQLEENSSEVVVKD